MRLDQPIQARVVVELIGEPVGVTEGGVLSQVNREVTVEALPMEIPEHLELDVTGMAIGDTLRLVDLPAQEGVKYLDDPEETVLATVTMPTRIVEPEPEEVEGEELEEGELPEGEVPEGEEAPAEGEAKLRTPRAPPDEQRTDRGLGAPLPSGRARLDAGPARRGARQPGPRVRADAPQRRLARARRAGPSARRFVALQVLGLARRSAARRPTPRRC